MISLLAVGRRQESRHSPLWTFPSGLFPPDCATFFLLVSEQWQQKALLQHIHRATRWVSPNLAAAAQLQEVIQQMVQIHDKSKHRREKRLVAVDF